MDLVNFIKNPNDNLICGRRQSNKLITSKQKMTNWIQINFKCCINFNIILWHDAASDRATDRPSEYSGLPNGPISDFSIIFMDNDQFCWDVLTKNAILCHIMMNIETLSHNEVLSTITTTAAAAATAMETNTNTTSTQKQ